MQNKNLKESGKILVVDDSLETLEIIKRNLDSKGYSVFTSSNVTDAIRFLNNTPVDLVVTDLRMPSINGIQLVKHVRENCKETEVLVITGFPSVKSAVEAIKSGAEEYLTKPFTDEELFSSVQKVFNKLYAARTTQKQTVLQGNIYGIVGESQAMQNVFRTIEKISSTDVTALITGESGTGKELVARAIHYRSHKSTTPFVAVNCAAIPNELLESELFGYVKGAFTGANETRAGFFQTAEGGTIFLDEISNTSLSMQAKLLRVLQEKEFYMVGDKKPIKVAVRIIASTNVELLHLVKKGNFREDLYYRLNVVNILIPPLRERGNDIFLLINYFANKYTKEIGRKNIPSFTDKALEALKNYYWPGNVRELQNLLHHLIILNDDDTIDISDLLPAIRYNINTAQTPALNKTLNEIEHEYILNVLASVENNKTEAARILGIDRKTLREKLKDLPSSESGQ
jgi:two-component system, NtrC family, response regulator HydG